MKVEYTSTQGTPRKLTRREFIYRTMAVGVSASLVPTALASCGGTASSGGSASSGLLDEIKQRGRVTVGTEAAYAPFEFIREGKIVGYGKDILDSVVKDLGVELEQLDLPFQGILPGLTAKKFDFVATSVLVTEERAEKYAFTMPISEGSINFLKRKGDDRIQKVEDASGLVVATQLGSAGEAVTRSFDEKLKSNGEGLADLKLFKAFPETYQALANEQVDLVAQSRPNIDYLLTQEPDTYEIVGPLTPDEKTWISWVTRPEDLDFRDYLNERIGALSKSGELAKLQEKWFGTTMEVPDSGYLPPGAI